MIKTRNTEEYKFLKGHQVEVIDLITNNIKLFSTLLNLKL